jgi:hypothetical protein
MISSISSSTLNSLYPPTIDGHDITSDISNVTSNLVTQSSAIQLSESIAAMVARDIIVKQTAKLIMKQVAERTAKTIGARVSAEVAEKICERVAIKVTEEVVETSAKVAVKASMEMTMGPVGMALLILDVFSLALDIWDPANYNSMQDNGMLSDMKTTFEQALQTGTTKQIQDMIDLSKSNFAQFQKQYNMTQDNVTALQQSLDQKIQWNDEVCISLPAVVSVDANNQPVLNPSDMHAIMTDMSAYLATKNTNSNGQTIDPSVKKPQYLLPDIRDMVVVSSVTSYWSSLSVTQKQWIKTGIVSIVALVIICIGLYIFLQKPKRPYKSKRRMGPSKHYSNINHRQTANQNQHLNNPSKTLHYNTNTTPQHHLQHRRIFSKPPSPSPQNNPWNTNSTNHITNKAFPAAVAALIIPPPITDSVGPRAPPPPLLDPINRDASERLLLEVASN